MSIWPATLLAFTLLPSVLDTELPKPGLFCLPVSKVSLSRTLLADPEGVVGVDYVWGY